MSESRLASKNYVRERATIERYKTALVAGSAAVLQSTQWQSDLLLSRCVFLYFNMFPFSSTSNASNEVEKLLFAACYVHCSQWLCLGDRVHIIRTPYHRIHRPRHLQLRLTPFVRSSGEFVGACACACAHASSAYRTTIQRKTSFYTWLKYIAQKKKNLTEQIDERGKKSGNVHKLALRIFGGERTRPISCYRFLTNQHRRLKFSHARILFLRKNTFIQKTHAFVHFFPTHIALQLICMCLCFSSLFLAFLSVHSTAMYV